VQLSDTVRSCLVVAAALAMAPSAGAEAQDTRSVEIGRPSTDTVPPIGRYVFAGVAIDQYGDADLWKTLENAVNDSRGVHEVLRDSHGFEAPDEWFLENEDATRMAIVGLVDDLANTLLPDDALVFMFSGHTANEHITFDGERVGSYSYLVPVDATEPPAEQPNYYLDIDDLLDELAALPARHVFVILNGLFTGSELSSSIKSRLRGAEEAAATQLITRRSRHVMTSAGVDQVAADAGADFPAHSLFGGWLVEGLRRAAQPSADDANPDANSDGITTSTELFMFVSGRVVSASESLQYPDFGAFKFDNRGDLVLLSSDAR